MTPRSFRFLVAFALAWAGLLGASVAVAAAPTLLCFLSGFQSVQPQAPRTGDGLRFVVVYRPVCVLAGCVGVAEFKVATVGVHDGVVRLDVFGSLVPIGMSGALPVSAGPSVFEVTTAAIAPLPAGRYVIEARLHAIDDATGAVESCPATTHDFRVSAAPSAPPETVTVVEYYHAAMDHYFATAGALEIAALDAGTIAGWARTGQQWKAWASGRSGNQGLPVCRYYFHASGTSSSHFFSASGDECDAVAARFGDVWTLETSSAWEAPFPTLVDGLCPSPGSTAVKRFWNNRADSNHRYVTTFDLENEMRSKGWIQEGWGSAGTAMCTAP